MRNFLNDQFELEVYRTINQTDREGGWNTAVMYALESITCALTFSGLLMLQAIDLTQGNSSTKPMG